MQDFRNHLRLEVLLLGSLQHAPDGLALVAIASLVSGLRDETRLHGVKKIKVVILELAQLQEVEARLGPLLDEQVDGDVAYGRLNYDRHRLLAATRRLCDD